MSNSPLEKIDRIYLDYRSRTSVMLIKVLAANFWKRDFRWEDTSEDFDFVLSAKNEAVVLIGDQCFEYEDRYEYKCDLSEEWKRVTGLPFVFACWISNKQLPDAFLDDFNNALSYGVKNIDLVVERFGNSGTIQGEELRKYLTDNIDFILDNHKKEGMDLFLELQKKL
jgi:chorismate dehydratase